MMVSDSPANIWHQGIGSNNVKYRHLSGHMSYLLFSQQIQTRVQVFVIASQYVTI